MLLISKRANRKANKIKIILSTSRSPNPGKEPTLEEASSNIKPGDTNATTSENEGRTAAKERTADHAGSPDGGADL